MQRAHAHEQRTDDASSGACKCHATGPDSIVECTMRGSGHTNDVDGVCILRPWDADQKVVGLYITVDKGFLVNCLHMSDLRVW